ncbi:Ig-like domain-containing protein, partial [Pasteurella multocida]|uniref:Ig-like domain-containing protein n=1 Tax=Pasteurella multocida TaxID=747 RepID=UPI003D15F669
MTNQSPFPVTVTFGAAVTGFDVSKISASNAALSAFVGSGTTYTFQATPSSDGPVSLSVAANSAADTASNQNLASNTLSITYDTQAPTVAV